MSTKLTLTPTQRSAASEVARLHAAAKDIEASLRDAQAKLIASLKGATGTIELPGARLSVYAETRLAIDDDTLATLVDPEVYDGLVVAKVAVSKLRAAIEAGVFDRSTVDEALTETTKTVVRVA